jgi:cell division protein FtsI (penicillin-binding protein 3)
MTPNPQESRKTRLVVVYFLVALAFFALSLRIIFIVATGDKVIVNSLYDPSKVVKRGDIIDRNGIIVATDLKTKSLYVSNALVKNPKLLATKLSETLPGLDYKDILQKISKKENRGWILIKRNITPSQQDEVQNLKMAGLLFEDDLIRVYPQKTILSHLVGYVDLDRNGLAGVEMTYNDMLKKGKENLQLAMDVRIQDVLEDELNQGMQKYNALGAAGIVMNVNNGEILAVSSLPNFDPNNQTEAGSNERFNRATYGVYELGSILKIFTNTIAFEKNLVKMEDVYNVKDPIKYGRFTINDDHPDKPDMNVAEIFAHSSNIGTVQIAKKIGEENQQDFLKKIGMLDRLDCDFPALGRPIFPKKWREINLFTISYGHGIAVTPLHVANATSAIINGGILYDPSFIKLENDKPKGERVIKESTSKLMQLMLREVVINGTGKFANIEGYEVGGKTGTAERAEFGSYNKSLTMASFVAAFPISEPKYLVLVVFDRPNAAFNTGGMVAAPVAGKIIKNIAPILDISPK